MISFEAIGTIVVDCFENASDEGLLRFTKHTIRQICPVIGQIARNPSRHIRLRNRSNPELHTTPIQITKLWHTEQAYR